jgi:hypothetical protein
VSGGNCGGASSVADAVSPGNIDVSAIAPPTSSTASSSAAGLFANPPASRIARRGSVVIGNFVAAPEMMKIAITAT